MAPQGRGTFPGSQARPPSLAPPWGGRRSHQGSPSGPGTYLFPAEGGAHQALARPGFVFELFLADCLFP